MSEDTVDHEKARQIAVCILSNILWVEARAFSYPTIPSALFRAQCAAGKCCLLHPLSSQVLLRHRDFPKRGCKKRVQGLLFIQVGGSPRSLPA